MALTTIKLAAILERKGLDAIVKIYPDAVFNPATNKTILGDVVEYNVKIIPPYKNAEGFKKTELITAGKGWTGLANKDLSFTIKAGLILVIYNEEWIVTGFTPLSNKNGILFYLLQIER